MSAASFSVGAARATLGAAPPAFDVLKNTESKSSKSRSAVMRSIRTEPTMPRHPTMPTFIPCPCLPSCPLSVQRGDHRVAHVLRADLRGALAPDVRGPQPPPEYLAHGRFDAVGLLGAVQRVAQHHRRRKDGRQRIGDPL